MRWAAIELAVVAEPGRTCNVGVGEAQCVVLLQLEA